MMTIEEVNDNWPAGTRVNVEALPGDIFFNDFTGRITKRGAWYDTDGTLCVTVDTGDEDDNVWDVDIEQISSNSDIDE